MAHKLYGVPEVALLCKVSQPLIHQEIGLGRLIPSFITEGKQRNRYLFTLTDIRDYQVWRTKTYNEQFDPLPNEEDTA